MDTYSSKKFTSIGGGIWVHKNVEIGNNVKIGHGSCVGYTLDENSSYKTKISNNVQIGALCVIELGVEIGEEVSIDHYCRIGFGTQIGQGSQLKYGIQIFKNVMVGKNCIIAGDLSNRTIIEDYVTFQGEIAHSYRDTTVLRSKTEEPAPTIKRGTFIGVNALIIGDIVIGPRAYIAAGEIIRADVPPETVVYKGKRYPLESWRGLIKLKE